MEGITNSPEAFLSQLTMETFPPATLYFKGSALTSLTPPNSNKTAAVKVEIESCFMMPLKAELHQIRGKMSRGFSDSVLAAKAQLQTTLAAAKVEITRFFNWGIG